MADADGRVAWQTNTAHKDVVGFKLLPNGNLILHCSKGNFVSQSFDYPTDTLLVGQALRAWSMNNKLVIWASENDISNGPFSLVLDNVALNFQPTSELDEAYAFSIRGPGDSNLVLLLKLKEQKSTPGLRVSKIM